MSSYLACIDSLLHKTWKAYYFHENINGTFSNSKEGKPQIILKYFYPEDFEISSVTGMRHCTEK